jgi:hypothetical protein
MISGILHFFPIAEYPAFCDSFCCAPPGSHPAPGKEFGYIHFKWGHIAAFHSFFPNFSAENIHS